MNSSAFIYFCLEDIYNICYIDKTVDILYITFFFLFGLVFPQLFLPRKGVEKSFFVIAIKRERILLRKI